MKIGILTQPLLANYGGVLQNYALQTVLKDLGHDPITLRINPVDRYPYWKRPLWFLKNLSCRTLDWSKYPPNVYKQRIAKCRGINEFIEDHITVGRIHNKYTVRDIKKYHLEALVVGSDQTWRPRYNWKTLYDMFLHFARRSNIKRIAYAASFGTNEWEFTPEQTEVCKRLIQQFDAVSVREESGVDLCRKWLDHTAEWVLDPTFLLSPERYNELCSDIPREAPYLFAYVLDITDHKRAYIEGVAKQLNLVPRIVQAYKAITPEDTPEKWLAKFRDAGFVITDSFHGTAFSINYGRPFLAFQNAGRGNARFDSLVKDFGIGHRILSEIPDAGIKMPPELDWELIRKSLDRRREESITFLRGNL